MRPIINDQRNFNVNVNANVNSPPGAMPFLIIVLVHVLQRENFEDPPHGAFLQLVGDFLHSIRCIRRVATRSGPIVARGA